MAIDIDIIRDSPFWQTAKGRQTFTGYDRSASDITHIAIHGTGGPRGYGFKAREGRRKKWYPEYEAITSAEYALHDFAIIYKRKLDSARRKKEYGKGNDGVGSGCFHFYISEQGKIYQTLDPLVWGIANNLPYSISKYASYTRPWEDNTISIEHHNPGKNNSGSYSEDTAKSGFDLVLYLLQTYPSITSIAGHGAGMANWPSRSKKYKLCPGSNYDWDGLANFLTERGYTYDLKKVKYTGSSASNNAKRSGTVYNEYIENIVCTNPNAPISESDKQTENKIIADNTTDYEHINDGNENTNADIFKDDPYSYDSASMKEVANANVGVVIEAQGTWTPSSSPSYVETPARSEKVLTKGEKTLRGQLSWTITGCTAPGGYAGGGASTVPISTSTTKMLAEGVGVLRKGDLGTCVGSLTGPGSPIPCTCKFEITDAGQTKVRSN